MNLRQERLLSRRSQLGRERFKCWNAWCSWHRQRHERGRYRCVALSLFTDPAVHHVRVQAMRQGHTTDAGPRLGTQGKYLCLELLAVFTPAWAVLIQRLFHRLHDPPSWGRCPLHAGSSRWDRRALTDFHLLVHGSGTVFEKQQRKWNLLRKPRSFSFFGLKQRHYLCNRK